MEASKIYRLGSKMDKIIVEQASRTKKRQKQKEEGLIAKLKGRCKEASRIKISKGILRGRRRLWQQEIFLGSVDGVFQVT